MACAFGLTARNAIYVLLVLIFRTRITYQFCFILLPTRQDLECPAAVQRRPTLDTSCEEAE